LYGDNTKLALEREEEIERLMEKLTDKKKVEIKLRKFSER